MSFCLCRVRGILVLSTLSSGLLLMFVLMPEPGGMAFVDIKTTAIAFLALLAAVLVADEAMMGDGASALQAAAAAALPVAFFVRQVDLAESIGERQLAAGGQMVLFSSFLISLALVAARLLVRWYRRGRSIRRR